MAAGDEHSIPEYIYHERQLASMCGQHCLNNLLQGPYFSAGDLAEIAAQLDDDERTLLGRGVSAPSSNVDDAGNFSEGVLQKSLQKHDVALVRSFGDISDVVAHPEKEDALVCNLESHWIAFRRIGDHFINLNSLNSRPEAISPFYLSSFLGQMVQERWSIFRVEGTLPKCIGHPSAGGDRASWHRVSDIIKDKGDGGDKSGRSEYDDDPELAMALAMSLGGDEPSSSASSSSSSSSSSSHADGPSTSGEKGGDATGSASTRAGVGTDAEVDGDRASDGDSVGVVATDRDHDDVEEVVGDSGNDDEDEDLMRAIAMSLESQ